MSSHISDLLILSLIYPDICKNLTGYRESEMGEQVMPLAHFPKAVRSQKLFGARSMQHSTNPFVLPTSTKPCACFYSYAPHGRFVLLTTLSVSPSAS